jgi:hypothetical protein
MEPQRWHNPGELALTLSLYISVAEMVISDRVAAFEQDVVPLSAEAILKLAWFAVCL